jgi:hypothetical protein
MEEERRVNLRAPFFTDVILRSESFDCVVGADLVNISINGMLVQGGQVLPLGSECVAEIQVTGNHSRLVIGEIQGKVVRVDARGAAIRFTSRLEWFVLFTVYAPYCRQTMDKVEVILPTVESCK